MSMFRSMKQDLFLNIFSGLVGSVPWESISASKKLFGKIVKQDYINVLEAMDFDRLVNAAEKGGLISMIDLADLLYEKSINRLWGCDEAYKLYKEIAGRDFSNEEEKKIIAGACYRLGVLYFIRYIGIKNFEGLEALIKGYGTEEDRIVYLKKAASLGNADAKIHLYLTGKYHDFIEEETAVKIEENVLDVVNGDKGLCGRMKSLFSKRWRKDES